MLEKVLILDGKQRSALAATRSLGKKGIPVIVAGEKKSTLAGSSKYCAGTFSYPSPYEKPDEFIETVRRESVSKRVKILLPMTDVTTCLLLKNRERLKEFIIPCGSYDSFEGLTDKWRLFKAAETLCVPVPRTYFIRSLSGLNAIINSIKYPAVLKPFRSKIPENGRWVGVSVKYANSWGELEASVKAEPFRSHPFLIQEYIEGTGQGLFALYDNGRPVVFFAHKRLREKPPEGGVSVLCESVPVDGPMRDSAKKILDNAKWHGVAMVEFKVRDGVPYLMEVNARFWGSLQLAIDSGVDFPSLLYNLATGRPVGRIEMYRTGVRSRWLMGDLDNLYLTLLKKRRHSARAYASFLGALFEFSRSFGSGTRYDVNRRDDMGPFLHELKDYFLKAR